MRCSIFLYFLAAVIHLLSGFISGNDQIVAKRLGNMPMAFIENRGQWDDRVLYRANAGSAAIWITKDGAYHQFLRCTPMKSDRSVSSFHFPPKKLRHESESVKQLILKATILGADSDSKCIGEDQLDYRCNYFLGNDPSKWRTNVPTYKNIKIREIYPGIDIEYYGNGTEMEYDFIVSPGADYSQIEVAYEGAKSVVINDNGELSVETEWGEVIERCPVIYQIENGSPISVAGKFKKKGENSFGFALSEDYNLDLPLIIDPVLIYSTYLGGSTSDYGWDITVDESGCVYITGETWSSDFPTQGAFQIDPIDRDAFITKLNTPVNGLIYSTYLGGGLDDYGYSIAIDIAGCAYVTGKTASSDFPIQGAFQTEKKGVFHAFVTKLNKYGNIIRYSTYIGGDENEVGVSICVDVSECAYITGNTTSSNFPIQGGFQAENYGIDAFVTKINDAGDAIVYSTYLGGFQSDCGSDIDIDEAKCVYVAGYTNSMDFPIYSAFQSNIGGDVDCFISKLNAEGSGFIYSTYLGGSLDDNATGLVVDEEECAYITGFTESSDFPVGPDTFRVYQGDGDIFAAKVHRLGYGLIYGTFLGGSSYDYGYDIAIDKSGFAHITGETWSSDYPTMDAIQIYQGGGDACVTKLDSTGDAIFYSTYFGGVRVDEGRGIAVDDSGSAYVTGWTDSDNFMTRWPFQENQGMSDAFVLKIYYTYKPGDANSDGNVNVGDIAFIINHVFRSAECATNPPIGCPPDPYEAGDVNCDGSVNIGDAVYLMNYVFTPGSPPPYQECP